MRGDGNASEGAIYAHISSFVIDGLASIMFVVELGASLILIVLSCDFVALHGYNGNDDSKLYNLVTESNCIYMEVVAQCSWN